MKSVSKSIAIVIIFVLAISCNSVIDQSINDNPKKDFSWLIGNWKRTNDEAPEQTFENWKYITDTLYQGHGFSMVLKDTIWQETIVLVFEKNRWNFKVIGLKDVNSTIFELSEIDAHSFTCFNRQNDFPNYISYQLKGDSLKALIWGDSLEIPFNFVKLNE